MNFRLAQGEGKFPRGHGGDAYRIRGVRLGGMVRRVGDQSMEVRARQRGFYHPLGNSQSLPTGDIVMCTRE